MWYCDIHGCKNVNFKGRPEAVHEEGWTDTPEGQFCPKHKPKCQHVTVRVESPSWLGNPKGISRAYSFVPVPNKFCPECGERLSDD